MTETVLAEETLSAIPLETKRLAAVCDRSCGRCGEGPPTAILVRACSGYEAVPEATVDGWLCTTCLNREPDFDAYRWRRSKESSGGKKE